MLNDKQLKVVLSNGNTIVSASPGSGKTKTLVERAKYKLESIPRYKSLALITYTNSSADEISSRLISSFNEVDIFIGTIHSFCLKYILTPFSWIYNWNKPRVLNKNDEIELKCIFDSKNIYFNLKDLSKIKKLTNGEIDNSFTLVKNKNLNDNIIEIYFEFLEKKKSTDFNEILYNSFKMISENDFILTSLANKFYEIEVDEFQDTNTFQYEILKAINRKGVSTFFFVGDPRQSIYKFSGAINNIFEKASNDFSASIETLDVTYRSTDNIINLYSSLFDDHPKLINESKYKTNEIKEYNPNIKTIENYYDQTNNKLIGILEQLLSNDNISYSDIAILSPTWKDCSLITSYIGDKYPLVGLGALPHKSLNTSMFNLLKSICNFIYSKADRNLRVIKKNLELHILENNLVMDELNLNFICNSIVSQISYIDKNFPLLKGIENIEKIFYSIFQINHENLILSEIDELKKSNLSIGKYMQILSGVSGITINTIHQSKGLEYKVVILNKINQYKIPHQTFDFDSKSYEELTFNIINEGKSLFYVAISRAKYLLIILYEYDKPSFLIENLIKKTKNHS